MFRVPESLNWLHNSVAGRRWLRKLPARTNTCIQKWSLQLGAIYPGSHVSVVFKATRFDGMPVVLKIQFPHRESDHEAEALRVWAGRGAVQLIDYDPDNCALLIERCNPGNYLSGVAVEEALEVLGGLLPQLWVPGGSPFHSLANEAAGWKDEMIGRCGNSDLQFERKLLETSMEAVDMLKDNQGPQVLIHQDLHGDNVLRAQREPWLAIDPKPIVGEREFSLAPIIRSGEFGHSRRQVIHRLDHLTGTLGLDRERTRLWSLVQTVAWAFEDDRPIPSYIQIARWLSEA